MPALRKRGPMHEINIVPYVDVMLVLLVIFMVTAPILQTGIDVQLPETRNVASVNPEQNVVLSISREGLIYYGSEPINFSNIAERLKKDTKGPKDDIFLRADKDVKWGSIVSVVDVVRGAGFNRIQLVTKEFKAPR